MKGPYKAGQGPDGWYVYSPNDGVVGNVPRFANHDRQREIATRIALCLNFCDGLSNEGLQARINEQQGIPPPGTVRDWDRKRKGIS